MSIRFNLNVFFLLFVLFFSIFYIYYDYLNYKNSLITKIKLMAKSLSPTNNLINNNNTIPSVQTSTKQPFYKNLFDKWVWFTG